LARGFSDRHFERGEGPGDEVEKNEEEEEEHGTTREAPGALDPAVVVPLLGCKIYYGHSRYEP